MSSNRLDFFPETEIPDFLSDEECEHIISLAKESGLAMSIAGFDPAAYEGDLDEDMKEAGKNQLYLFGLINGLFHVFIEKQYILSDVQMSLFWPIFLVNVLTEQEYLTKIVYSSFIQTFMPFILYQDVFANN